MHTAPSFVSQTSVTEVTAKSVTRLCCLWLMSACQMNNTSPGTLWMSTVTLVLNRPGPYRANIVADDAPVLCSFVWRIHHVGGQVAELLTTACQTPETTWWYTVTVSVHSISFYSRMSSWNTPNFALSVSWANCRLPTKKKKTTTPRG
jgi:hypothetical protein